MPGVPCKIQVSVTVFSVVSRTLGFVVSLFENWPESCSPKHIEQLEETDSSLELSSSRDRFSLLRLVPPGCTEVDRTDEEGAGTVTFLPCPVLARTEKLRKYI